MSEQNPYRPDYCIQDPGDCKWPECGCIPENINETSP